VNPKDTHGVAGMHSAGALIAQGIEPMAAGEVALIRPIADDADMRDALAAAAHACFRRMACSDGNAKRTISP
jgi:hypothetical protein